MYQDAMIDIETLSTKNNAVILTIGAIKFYRGKDICPLENTANFYRRIDIKSCKKLNMDIDKNTVQWWNNQSDEAKYEALVNKDRKDIKEVLEELSEFIKDCKHIWANSPSFDCVILENAYRCCELEIPWKFWNLRDCRTIYDIGKTTLKSIVKETKHNALDDCYNQILCLNKSYKNLKII
jgi:DNA polymerase III epsilon subunit-like protein